ncbi:lasso RiPP family leader peptide-containing protein [Streptomyces sp. NPDC007205]|uniref:lasso RiPP family leader peptide-containing protein n=1 Tax=Streptomyces sp. NPDC007205 TaxID=3154316 RepID=UPI0033D30989
MRVEIQKAPTNEERVAAEEPVAYEPPMVAEAGTFAHDTRGGAGQYREAGVGRFL